MNTPVKIIAAILIPLLIAIIIRFSNWPGVFSKNKSNDKEQSGKKNPNEEKRSFSIKVHTTWLLPKELIEISGISWISDDRFACVQDELGKVYIYNTLTAKIEKEIPFGEPGDYEGIAIAGETIYVLQANGTIIEIENYDSAKPLEKKYKTQLTKKQDCESMAYDQKNNRLLIAIKAEESDNASYKGIYAFNLKTKEMAVKPVYRIDLNHQIFNGEKSKKKTIQPSDMAIHPLSGDIYIIEATTKPKLLILNASGSIRSLHDLPGSDFPQPEGITFSPEGKMYISNEGKNKPGNIIEVQLSGVENGSKSGSVN